MANSQYRTLPVDIPSVVALVVHGLTFFEEGFMMKLPIVTLSIGALLSVGASTALAAKPVDDNGVPFGNGAPSGQHFNLVLLGKKAHFQCPPPEFDEDSNQVYGNVIFIPREQGDDPINILMESGAKGPKGNQDAATLEVIDWCTESFTDYGENQGDPAVLRLPKADGYAVYARILGKPGDDGEPSAHISPSLAYVEDEAGNDLVLLGLVDADGTATFSSDGETIYRTSTDTSKKGKGAQKFSNLTALFEWTGEACYVQTDASDYCYDEFGNFVCTGMDLCCEDADFDGIYESCSLLTDVGELVDDGMGGMTLQCPEGSDEVNAQCRSYDNEWVFNISDFVGYLWELDSTGAYNIQVRFYPVK